MGFLPWKIQVAFPGETQPRQSRATQQAVHAGIFSVSIIHRTPTWTAGSLTCTPMSMYAIVHKGVRTYVTESALKVDSGRKIPCRTVESNLRQRRAGPILYQQSYIPTTDEWNIPGETVQSRSRTARPYGTLQLLPVKRFPLLRLSCQTVDQKHTRG